MWVRRSVLRRIEADLRAEIAELERDLAGEMELKDEIRQGKNEYAKRLMEMTKERDQARAVAQTLYREIRDQLANADSEADWIDDQTPNAALRLAAKQNRDVLGEPPDYTKCPQRGRPTELNRYRVASLFEPSEDDPWFDDLLEAVQVAGDIANKDYRDPVAVWNADNTIEYLFLADEQFRRM